MSDAAPAGMVGLSTATPIWPHVFMPAPLVLVGTLDPDGRHDLAPKHMTMPLGWDNYFGFVCHPCHGTHANAARTGEFTVSVPTPQQIVETSLAASPREPDHSKPALAALRTLPARVVTGVLVAGAQLHLECRLDRMVTGIGEASLIVGRVVAAAVTEELLRSDDLDDAERIARSPLLGYVHPGRFAVIGETFSFPFPAALDR